MQRLIITTVVVGLIAGLLVGGFHNLFTVPVMERAIALEEERSAADTGAAPAGGEEAPLVSLGMQRVGMTVGTGIYGAILGLVFAGGYVMLRRIGPYWGYLPLALVVGALGFWAISLFPFIKYPLNPPGVGDPGTLVYRQGFQTLFMLLSVVGAAGLLLGINRVKATTSEISRRMRLYVMVFLAYGVFALIIVFAIPGNPDPVPVPIDLLELFRTLTMIGQFLMWSLLAVGVALALTWYSRSEKTTGDNRATATSGRSSGTPTS